jgi:AraC-like DNA-binding protein
VRSKDSVGLCGILGPDARLTLKNDSCAIFHLENETGNGVVTVFDVFPGASLFYNDLHMLKINGHDSTDAPGAAGTLVINHCREGRFECEFQNGECGYLGEGDLVVSEMPMPLKASLFPITHYHGISIMLDVPVAAQAIDRICALLRTVPIDLYAIKERLLTTNRPYFLMRGTAALTHIFSELYDAPPALKASYIRLKLIELLLFLSVTKPEDAEKQRYFYKTHVAAVKAMRDYLTANLEHGFTLEELSQLFDIPLTAMKSCFKTVFGTPIQTYMREYRLQTAAVLLRETNDPIADIATRVGYDSHAKFSAAFRSFTGVTPSKYRKVSVLKV